SNVILGDSGLILASPVDGTQFGTLPITLGRVVTLDNGIGSDDTITTNGANDLVMGGAGNDHITIGDGTNLVFGDGGFFTWVDAGLDGGTPNPANLDIAQSVSDPLDGNDVIEVGPGNNLVVGGGGNDRITVTAGAGFNVILGDSGKITRAAADTHRFGGLPITLGRIETTDDAIGGTDTILTGDGSNVVFGGAVNDAITLGNGTNLVFGDAGYIDWAPDGGIHSAVSTSWTIGGDDRIVLGNGSNLVVGGAGSDNISGGNGFNVILGDNAEIDSAGANTDPFGGVHGLPITLGMIKTTAPHVGECATLYCDVISTGNANDIVFGGPGADKITTGNGTNIVFGDDGQIDWMLDGNPKDIDRVVSTNSTDGGNDLITVGSGSILVVGGYGNDTITGGTDSNLIIGDNGAVEAALADTPRFGALPITIGVVKTTDPTDGGNDVITTGSVSDIILGGPGNDTITTGGGTNVVFGDSGEIDYVTATDSDASDIDAMFSTDPNLGGNDVITIGTGNAIVIGGKGQDTIVGGSGANIIVGDNGAIIAALSNDASSRFGALPITVGSVESTATGIGDDDKITGGSGRGIMIGGLGNDTITTGDGGNIVVGDNGKIVYAASAPLFDGNDVTLDIVQTIAPEDGGGVDRITTGSGNDVVIGGDGADLIDAGAGNNVVIGDNASVFYFAGKLDLVQSTETGADGSLHGGGDTITTGSGNDVVVGGYGSDWIDAGAGANLVFGDSVILDFAKGTGILLTATSIANAFGGGDTIITGVGDDVVIGGVGGDTINAGDGNNTIVGDNGTLVYDPAGTGKVWSISTTTPAVGSADTITTGVGNDVVIGGFGGDTITDFGGTNIVLGDQGFVDWVVLNGNPADIDKIVATDPTIGGNDTITITGSGNDVVIGGTGSDTISTGSGDDLIFGDFGQVIGAATGTTIPATLPVPTGPTTFT
ncbi:MAG: hypothetical protein QOE91_1261, partial [Gaiellaceae bacterium]|nr:hypothetical protein [Gaiellaceae bacterium]